MKWDKVFYWAVLVLVGLSIVGGVLSLALGL